MKTEKVSTSDKSKLRIAALDLLTAPDFFRRALRILRREGLVGEKLNALVLYIVAISALLTRPLNALVKGSSSSGKNFLVNHVLRLLPKTAVREITSSSATAWNYGEDDFRNKVVYLQERNDAAGSVHSLRLLISEGKLKRIVTVRENGRLVKRTIVANGPISSISTTTKDQIETDDETRHITVRIDESREQTRRINMVYFSTPSTNSTDSLEMCREAYRLVSERAADSEVVLPCWFSSIGEQVDDSSVTVRRYSPAFVGACKAIALLRSFQKTPDGENAAQDQIEVDFVDYSIAAILFDKVFVESLHPTADKNSETRLAVDELCKANNGAGISADELAQHLGISKERAYARLRSASDAGVVERANGSQRGNLKLYRPVDLPRFVPEPQMLFSEIREIPGPVEFIHPLTGEVVRFSRTGRNISGGVDAKGSGRKAKRTVAIHSEPEPRFLGAECGDSIEGSRSARRAEHANLKKLEKKGSE